MNFCGNYNIIKKDNNIYTYNVNYENLCGLFIDQYLNNLYRIHKIDKIENIKQIIYYDIDTIEKINNIDLLFYNIIQTPLKYKGIKTNVVGGKCGFAVSIWCGDNYYHFITDELISIIKLNKEYGNDIDIIISCNKKFAHELLNIFNIKNKIIILNEQSIGSFDSIIRFHETNSTYVCKKNINLLRDMLIKKNLIKFEKTKKGIIIFRKEFQRKILNFDLFYKLLITMFNFISWEIFDSLNIKETIELFKNTSYIIGVQGSGLTNMIFAPNNITIIEIAPVNFPNLCFNHLSNMLDNQHYTYTINDNGENNGCQINIDLENFYFTFENIII